MSRARERRRKKRDHGGREDGDTATRQEMPTATRSCKRQRTDSPLAPWGEFSSADIPISGF